jgi:hypothetical protein
MAACPGKLVHRAVSPALLASALRQLAGAARRVRWVKAGKFQIWNLGLNLQIQVGKFQIQLDRGFV